MSDIRFQFANPNSPGPSECEGPWPVSLAYARDAHGRVVATTNDIGGVSTRAYDAMGRLAGRGGPADFPAQFAYDALGRRTSLSTTRNGSGWDTTTWAYDPATGLATAKTYADATVVSYSHTADGLPLRTTWARGAWRESGYDDARREVARSYSDPSLNCAFERDVFGAIVAASNAVAAIAVLRDNPGMATIFKAFAYSLDNLLRPTGRNADIFGYDARSQLTAATLRSSATNAYTYAYDSAGNRQQTSLNGKPLSYAANELNQYDSTTTYVMLTPSIPWPVTTNYVHDLDGNLLTNDVWSYTWDAENRLATVCQGDSCAVSNAYDAFSRRVLKVTPAETHTFLYDGWNVVREVVRSSATGTVTETLDYYWGRDLSGSLQGAGGVGGLLAYTRNGSLRIPVYDHIGNVVAVVDDSGAVVAAYEYAPFGDIVAQSGPEAEKVPFRFSTKYFDPETGLYYYGYRFYSPMRGRWINRDPATEVAGKNLYVFCKNNVIAHYDCLGLIDVKVLSLHENTFWEGMFRNAEKYRTIEVNTPEDIIIYRGSSQSLNGSFSPSPPHADACGKTVYISVSIFLNQTLVKNPVAGVVYTFSPHTIENGIINDNPSFTSDHSPFVESPVLMHEYAHAEVFIREVVPLFKSKLESHFAGGTIPAGMDDELKKLLDEARKEYLQHEVDYTTSEERRGFELLGMQEREVGANYEYRK